MGAGDCDYGVIAAVIAGHGGSGNCREGHSVVGMVSRIESLVSAVNLIEVMVLAADVERLEELVDYNPQPRRACPGTRTDRCRRSCQRAPARRLSFRRDKNP
jgi:hypothetical protein